MGGVSTRSVVWVNVVEIGVLFHGMDGFRGIGNGCYVASGLVSFTTVL